MSTGSSSEILRTGTSSYTHQIDATGRVVACSEATDFMHFEPDQEPQSTGFGFCPHTDEPLVVCCG